MMSTTLKIQSNLYECNSIKKFFFVLNVSFYRLVQEHWKDLKFNCIIIFYNIVYCSKILKIELYIPKSFTVSRLHLFWLHAKLFGKIFILLKNLVESLKNNFVEILHCKFNNILWQNCWKLTDYLIGSLFRLSVRLLIILLIRLLARLLIKIRGRELSANRN